MVAEGTERNSERGERIALARARVGQTIGGKFRLERLLGVGGMAAVYAARHRNGKVVALKVLHRALDTSRRERERFLREAYVANTIDHAGVVQIFDDGIDAGTGELYLVMELLEGATLADLQKAQGGTFELTLAVEAVDQVLDVLAVAHLRGVVHRDIKPANLFVTDAGQLKVLDFGIARLLQRGDGSAIETLAGTMLGTPAFMPQEQARGRWSEVESRTDLWAVGATLFTLVSGEHVHLGETANEQLGRAMTIAPRSLASVAPHVPQALCAVVDRALRFERHERFPDARTMQLALRDALPQLHHAREQALQIEAMTERERPLAQAVASKRSATLGGHTTLSASFALASAARELADARARDDDSLQPLDTHDHTATRGLTIDARDRTHARDGLRSSRALVWIALALALAIVVGLVATRALTHRAPEPPVVTTLSPSEPIAKNTLVLDQRRTEIANSPTQTEAPPDPKSIEVGPAPANAAVAATSDAPRTARERKPQPAPRTRSAEAPMERPRVKAASGAPTPDPLDLRF